MIHQLCTFILIIFVFLINFTSGFPSTQSNVYYTKFIYENVDPAVLMNPRFVNYYVDCLLDGGKCTADGHRLKETIPEAVATHCAKCSPHQKDFVEKVIKILRDQYPKKYCRLANRYDSNTQYRHKNEITNDDDSDCV